MHRQKLTVNIRKNFSTVQVTQHWLGQQLVGTQQPNQEIAQRGYGVCHSGDIPEPFGCNPVQCAPESPYPISGILDQMTHCGPFKNLFCGTTSTIFFKSTNCDGEQTAAWRRRAGTLIS